MIVRRSARPDADVDYLFAQVNVTAATVDYGQNCGNILTAVGPLVIERGPARHGAPLTWVRIYMENTGQLAVVEILCDVDGVDCADESRIDGVPDSISLILLHFSDVASSSCGVLLSTDRVHDRLDGVEVTCTNNGMPAILLRAYDLGCTDYETCEQLDDDDVPKRRLESICLQTGLLMQLGDVSQRMVPKMTLIAEPRHGGTISSRTFTSHRCHVLIDVLGTMSVVSTYLLPDSAIQGLVQIAPGNTLLLSVEHPIGGFNVTPQLDAGGALAGCGLSRMVRLPFVDEILIPARV